MFDPCGRLDASSQEKVTALRGNLAAATPRMQAIRYFPSDEQPAAEKTRADPVLLLEDDEDLWSDRAQEVVDAHLGSLIPLSDAERQSICTATVGQGENKKWHTERTGRLTASLFKRICCCVKTASILKTLLYPSDRAVSEAMAYGRKHEGDAVASYASLMRSRGYSVQVRETGLHVHKGYSFLAASPDRIIVVDGEEGLLEVKCLPSKKGLTAEEACRDPKFCCRLEGGDIILKEEHSYHYLVQGQMAVTGHTWCDFVVWTERSEETELDNINVQRIAFDRLFWENEMLPALLHFVRHAFVPELLTRRTKRLGTLYTRGEYVSFKKVQKGFYVCQSGEGLTLKIRKLK